MLRDANMLIGVTINNRGEKDQSGKTGLEHFEFYLGSLR